MPVALLAAIGSGLTGAPFQASPSPLALFQKMLPVARHWREHQFTIEGHLEDRRQPRVVGGCDKVVKSAEIGRLLRLSESPCFRFPGVGNHHEPWLMHHESSGAFPDGTDIPHQVLTTWSIAYRRSP